MADSKNTLTISETLTSLERNPNNPIDKAAVHLLKTIQDLQKQVIERKTWAQRIVADASSRVSNDYFELHALREWKADQEKTKNMITDAVMKLYMQNAEIRADIRALKLSGSESERALQEVFRREKKCAKKLAELEKQTNYLRAQCEDEELRALEMERELVQTEREASDVEIQWKQETKERERMLALAAEETRKVKTRKAHSIAQLSKLHREIETDAQVTEDERRRLEDELSHLRVSEDLSFLYNYDDATSSNQLSARSESNCRTCMICMLNDVSVVLLPCTHQVLCFLCYERNFRALGTGCPYCHAEIKHSIKVYGSSL